MLLRRNHLYVFQQKQLGAALILIAFLLALMAGAYMVKSLQGMTAQSKQDEKTMQALNEAKAALIAWSVNYPNMPGLMPYPDRNGDNNYDGSSDCYASNVFFSPTFTVGRLPLFSNDPNCITTDTIDTSGVHDTPVTHGLSSDFRDSKGERLWYQVSRNLLHDYKSSGGHSNGLSPVINPSIINSPAHPWFVVKDRNGNIISDRVAAVIIAPGEPLSNQDRTGGIANANQYLDRVVMADGTPYTNYGYQDIATNPVQEFIIAEHFKNVSKTDPTYQNQTVEPYYFNDKLVFITIDELMSALEKRVGEVARSAIKEYEDTNGYYPYASQLGTTNNYACELTSSGGPGLTSGFLPINHQSCNYTRISATNTNITCSSIIFNPNTTEIETIRFDRTSGTATFSLAQSGSCTRASTTRCNCTGAGSCGTGGVTVICSNNSCTSNGINGNFSARNTKFRQSTAGCSHSTFPSKAFSCSNANSVITCNTTNGSFSNCGDADFSTFLPTWFSTNQWVYYVFYNMTRPSSASISVGSQSAEAMIATIGRPIISAPFAIKGSAQTRTVPSTRCSQLNEYLDSAENVSINNIYDAKSKLPSANYNDQTFVVEP